MSQFFDFGYEPNSKQTRVMVVPNITNSRALEADSFIDVIRTQIKLLGDDFYWYIPVPEIVSSLHQFKNVQQIKINMSGNMFHMRSNFSLDMIKLLQLSLLNPNQPHKFNIPYDVVYSHLPDWSVKRFTNKRIIGYSHWWEMDICNSISNMNNHLNFEHEILGALQMEVLFVNTIAQKNVVIDKAKKYFNESIIDKLENIIQPFYLATELSNIVPPTLNCTSKTIVFNHRCAEYKGFPKFIKQIKEYRKRRQDFNVWITQAQKYALEYNEDWIDTTYLNKSDYLKRLGSSSVVVTPYETHFGWSISATDAMSRGTPVLFEECQNYREIDNTAIFYSSSEELFNYLDSMLDDIEFRNKYALLAYNRALELSDPMSVKTLAKYLKGQ